MPRGGAREGAGRPATGRTTKVIRVVKNFPKPQTVIDIQETLQEYYQELQENPKRKTSPRWEKLGKLLKKIEEIDPTFLKKV